MKIKNGKYSYKYVYDLTPHGIPIIDDFFELINELYIDHKSLKFITQCNPSDLLKSREIYTKYINVYICHNTLKHMNNFATCLQFMLRVEGHEILKFSM